MSFQDLPGADLVDEGLKDLRAGKESILSLLVLIGAPRLRQSGVRVPNVGLEQPEHRMYELLAKEHGNDAHSRYNALLRRLISFERALECAR
ncbi:MAG TPA: hypothetical protein VI895_06635 [Bdellovibrionota bacterium]|nr:hypothetical protein [Bdellovibrionota bacterium]